MQRYLKVRGVLEGNLDFSLEDKRYFWNGDTLNAIETGIPTFVDPNMDDLTRKVSNFYDEIKFPHFDGMENYSSIFDKGRNNPFSKQLDDEISWDAKVLEVGCGTGQLSLFLGRGNREIHGVDISPGSLNLAEQFRDLHDLEKVYFWHMDVFNMPFKDDLFDITLSNGVLHHTKDARAAFRCLVAKTKPGGYIICGLYHKFGRIFTKIKQNLGKVIGKRVTLIDGYSRKLKDQKKRDAWVRDQFFNPHETAHLPEQVLSWFHENNVTFVNLLPHLYDAEKPLCQKRNNKELSTIDDFWMMFDPNQIAEGGFFVMVGQKNIP